jgi:pimeloyl-ACP methyl ester carboxylesterase
MSLIYRSSRIKLKPGQIFWREAGDTSNLPALVFLHGSWEDSRQWQDVMELLSQDFLCLAPDLLGFGDSVTQTTPTSIEIEVDCLAEFLASLKLRSVYLIGHSLGAWIATSYALKYPDAVRGVVVISPEGISLARWQKYNFFIKWLLQHPRGLKLWLLGLRAIDALADESPLLASTLRYWQNLQRFSTTSQLFLCRSTAKIKSELIEPKLPWLRMPVLVLQPDRDDPAVIADSQAFAQSARQAQYQWLKVELTDPDDHLAQQIAGEIDRFVDRVQSAIEREEGSLW